MRRAAQSAWDGLLILAMGGLLLWAGCVAKGDEFSEALNRERATRNLAAASHSLGYVATSESNNGYQRQRGLGHYVTGGLAQCAAVGVANAEHAPQMWTRSPARAALIFAPNLTAVGFACDGYCASVSCSFGITQPAAAVVSPVVMPLVARETTQPVGAVPRIVGHSATSAARQSVCPAPMGFVWGKSTCPIGVGRPWRIRLFRSR